MSLDEEKRSKARERYQRWKLNNPGRETENRRRWRAANPEKHAANHQRYAAAHPEKIKEKWQRHQAAHPEKCAARARKYAAKNPEKVRAALRAYFSTPEGKIARRNGEARRRHRMKSTDVSATTKEVANILAAASSCQYCERPFSEMLPPTLDHIKPLSKGGGHEVTNLAVACRPCNSSKGARDLSAFAPGANVSVVAVGQFT